jgi:CBS domain-containing protein
MPTISLSESHVPQPRAGLTAADVMAEHPCVRRPDQSVAAAVDLLQRGHERHIVVCDATDHVVGVLEDRRLAKLLAPLSWDELGQPLSRYMDRAVCRAVGTDSLQHVARLLESSASDAVVVTDPVGRLVGLVTSAEIVRAVASGP